MFLLYRVLFCNFANSSQICKTFLGLISCKCCNIVFFLYLLYVVFIFTLCKCKYCQQKCCNQINVFKKKKKKKLGKGIGNGLQTMGKKIGSLLPGLINSIVSFIFKAAGQAISFLAENTWLLILAVSLSTLSVNHTLNDFGGNHNTSENHS